LKAPFPYFGVKSKVAETVWAALGADVKVYVEPFAGSLAVLLGRPNGAGAIETVNDYDGLLANFWRATTHDPDAVAHHADNPVNECDLHARHLWMVGQRELITERLMADPDYYDVKAAGWWVWGACAWVGDNWCSGNGPWINVNGVLTDRRTLPDKGGDAIGITRQVPHIAGTGRGINRVIALPRREYIHQLFSELHTRLRNVRVACGDFERVLSYSATTHNGNGVCGVFLDPPYDAGNHADPYHTSAKGVSSRAREWALDHGDDQKMRIVFAGYDGEHGDSFEQAGWRTVAWSAQGGYSNQSGSENKHRERLWLSPHCMSMEK
jgi:DNA adenine methylase